MDISILRLAESGNRYALDAQLDAIFFEASATKSFASAGARAAFRQKWLGDYLNLNPNETFLAFSPTAELVGYLVGALEDPAGDPRYAELGYFGDFAHLTCQFPAHLHINVASQHRSFGIGARLVDAFVAYAASQGAPGVHICTGLGARNIRFYESNGFVELFQSPWNGRTIVMLGRRLG